LIFICPLPKFWNDIYQSLVSEHKKASKYKPNIAKPPVPLILAGWAYSSDNEKQIRWQKTIDWAEENGFSKHLRKLEEKDSYFVDTVSEYSDGPLGGPMHLLWDGTTKEKISLEEKKLVLAFFQSNWIQIAGEEIANVSIPTRITGKKGRQLEVKVHKGATCPWGSWTYLPNDDRRRIFTELRKNVNQGQDFAFFDHINFIED